MAPERRGQKMSGIHVIRPSATWGNEFSHNGDFSWLYVCDQYQRNTTYHFSSVLIDEIENGAPNNEAVDRAGQGRFRFS